MERQLIDCIRGEKSSATKGGIYHKIQIELAYHSNHIEGSQLSEEQTRYIYETNTVGMDGSTTVKVNDIVETVNHFIAFDYLVDTIDEELSEKWIKECYKILKQGTSDARKEWFQVGEYKLIPNEVGGRVTSLPENVSIDIASLLRE